MGDKLAKVLIACAPKLPPFSVISLKQNRYVVLPHTLLLLFLRWVSNRVRKSFRLSGPTITSLLAGLDFNNLMHLDVGSNSVGDSGALGIAIAIQVR